MAPAYDMNPNVEKAEHALALDARQSFPDLALVAATASFYRLESRQAERIIQQLREVVSGWRKRARAMELPASEIALVASAFAHAERGA